MQGLLYQPVPEFEDHLFAELQIAEPQKPRDGLSRVGDYYKSQNRLIEALRMYWIAPDRSKSEPLIEQLSFLLKQMIEEDKESAEDNGQSAENNGESAENKEESPDE